MILFLKLKYNTANSIVLFLFSDDYPKNKIKFMLK